MISEKKCYQSGPKYKERSVSNMKTKRSLHVYAQRVVYAINSINIIPIAARVMCLYVCVCVFFVGTGSGKLRTPHPPFNRRLSALLHRQQDRCCYVIRTTLGWVIDRSFTPTSSVRNTFTYDVVQVTGSNLTSNVFLSKRLRVPKNTSLWLPRE